MGDTACMVHGFSYASAIPNEFKQGNPVHALGESISFGRFMTESLSWEKWSSFSHKKYVEEAERYAKPGSVAQKKAFFEAHYKKIAAQKAAALLEQENATKVAVGDGNDNNHDDGQRVLLNNSNFEKMEAEIQYEMEDGNEHDLVGVTDICDVNRENEVSRESSVKRNSSYQLDNLENPERVSVSEGTGSPQMERSLLKNAIANDEEVSSVTSKKRSSLSSLKSSIQRKTWRIPATPAKPPVASHFNKENSVTEITNNDSMDKSRSSSKSLRALIKSIPIKAPDKEPISAATQRTTDSSGSITRRVPKDCLTPLRTPKVAASKGGAKYPSATPLSENRRMKTPVDPSGGSKTTGPKWHILSAVSKSLTACKKKLQSPASSTPFILRTEERAAKRKQRLEEKFNANEIQKVQQPQKTLKEKAENEFRKLSHSFCFKARPLPNFYKERETSKNQTKMNPVSQSQQAVLKRNNSNKKQGIGRASMPVPPSHPSSFNKNNGDSKNSSRKNVPNLGKLLKHDSTFPNIQ